jgi:transposase
MDIHRAFAEVVALLDGVVTRPGRVDMRRDRLEAFARSTLTQDDPVVVEATGNAAGLVEVLSSHVGRVVIANPKHARVIAAARIKTDKIDATVLAKLYASGFLPEVWVPDARTEAIRRQVTRRTRLVRQRTRLKTILQSILHAHHVPPCPHGDLFGRARLAGGAVAAGGRADGRGAACPGTRSTWRGPERRRTRHRPARA